jgi:hypothetical protein
MSRLTRSFFQRQTASPTLSFWLPFLFLAILLSLLLPACEEENNHPVTPHSYEFNWVYYDTSADQKYLQPLPPFSTGDNGEMWTCGYLVNGSFHEPVMACYTEWGWYSHVFGSQAYDSYAYDITVQPGNNQVWATIKVESPFGGEGIYRFASELSTPHFIVVQSLPDAGMLAFYDQTHGVMITRHLDQAASALWLFDGQNWTSQPFQLSAIPGNVVDVDTYGNDYLTYAITDDGYIVRWANQYLSFEGMNKMLYSIDITGVDEGWLCAGDGLYHKTADTSWMKESTYPGDKAFSVSFAGGKMWIAGEKDGTKKVWKLDNGKYSEESSEGTGNGRLIMIPQDTTAPYHGYILEDLRLLRREWEVQ